MELFVIDDARHVAVPFDIPEADEVALHFPKEGGEDGAVLELDDLPTGPQALVVSQQPRLRLRMRRWH